MQLRNWNLGKKAEFFFVCGQDATGTTPSFPILWRATLAPVQDGVDIYGDVPREVLGLEEGLLRGQSYEYWLEDGTAEFAQMAERVKRLGNYVVKVSRL